MRAASCWMIGVVVLGLGCKAKDSSKAESAKAQEQLALPAAQAQAEKQVELARRDAEAAAALAVKDAEAAKQTVEQLARDLADLDAKITAAATAIADAQTDADRVAAKARLLQLHQEQTELKQRLDKARDSAAGAVDATKINPECLNDPLAKGCSR